MMSNSRITTLSYRSNSCIYFEQLRDQPFPFFLDSCQPYSNKGRFDIISAAPEQHFATHGQVTRITSATTQATSLDDPFMLVKNALAQYPAHPSSLPFNGGALGYFAYDLNKRLENLPACAIQDISLPTLSVGIYLWAVIVDHQEKQTYLLLPPKEHTPENWLEIFGRLSTLEVKPTPYSRAAVSPTYISNLTKSEYVEKFTQIMQHIKQGDAYQVNFAQRWHAPFQGDPWMLYQHLRAENPAPFAAFIPLEHGAIISCSPERFLTVQNSHVMTMPIKGTAARNADPILDQQAAEDLLNSTKNRAENMMIVDLMRNDLGKSCVLGSVHVPTFCELQSFANVHHLVSTVCGTLRADKQPMDLLQNCFPGGSVTGAPKIRAMELIDQYEPHQRHIYCGTIGYIDVNGQMDTNIAIRTAVIDQQQLFFWGGGGIVADSQPDLEYQETIDKVQPFLAACSCLIL